MQAPGPEEVNWPTLWEGFRGRNIRALLTVVPIAAMIIFPIGIFAGAITDADHVLSEREWCLCLMTLLHVLECCLQVADNLLCRKTETGLPDTVNFQHCRQHLAADAAAVRVARQQRCDRCAL